jgi:hypothetical protein
VQVPPCLVSVCDPETKQCKIVDDPNPTPCDDGQFCTVGETCKAGKCQGGTTNTCGLDGDACTAITCKEATKSCVKEPQGDGTPCDDASDLCTVNAQCKNGQCVGTPKDCFFAPGVDECHVGTCDPKTGKCEPQPGNDGEPCSDPNDFCTEDKVCDNGVCGGGTAKDCSYMDNGDCQPGVCEPATGKCVSKPIPAGGACAVVAQCQVGTCDKNGDCVPAPAADGSACDDSNSCTNNDKCVKGACVGTPVGGVVTYFSETFKDNSKGWTLGTEWQIGAAKASPGDGEGSSFEDPAQDHTQAGDNGIAGVVIGGYPDESTEHDFSGAAGDVYLQFWRWLNTDSSLWMPNEIDCSADGVTWKNLWKSSGDNDSEWTPVSYKLTTCKSATMKIRWGFAIADASGIYTESSWNIDDVAVTNQSCF